MTVIILIYSYQRSKSIKKNGYPDCVDPRIGTSDYDGKRLPAWTDRILYKANVANYDNYKLSLRQHSYNAHQHFLQSDHKV